MITALIAIPLTLCLVIGLHELGHAAAARLCGIHIERIAIGFGKPLFTWVWARREWVWARWPLGGYVQLRNSRIKPVPTSEYPSCFDKKPVWMRCFVLSAGALSNALVAWVALTLMYLSGYQQQTPVVQSVTPNHMAALAHIAPGDRFLSLGHQKTEAWQEVGMAFIMNIGNAHVPVVLLKKNGEERQVYLDLTRWQHAPSFLKVLGITPAAVKDHTVQVQGEPFLKASSHALETSLQLLHFFCKMLKQLITGAIPFTALLGPLGLFALSLQSFLQGLSVFLYFIANLSLAVGLINLFPIPGLDGGSIVYAWIEKVRGKPISVAVEVLLHRLAVIAFAVFFIQLVMNDLQRLFLS